MNPIAGIGNFIHSAANNVGNFAQNAVRPIGQGLDNSINFIKKDVALPINNALETIPGVKQWAQSNSNFGQPQPQAQARAIPSPMTKPFIQPTKPVVPVVQNRIPVAPTTSRISPVLNRVANVPTASPTPTPIPQPTTVIPPAVHPANISQVQSTLAKMQILPGQQQFVQDMIKRHGGDPQAWSTAYRTALLHPGWNGKFYGSQETAANIGPNGQYQQVIMTRDYNGNPVQVPYGVAQNLMQSFGQNQQATNAAQMLSHPAQNTYLPGIDPRSNNYVKGGENAQFAIVKDTVNTDGSVDRGLNRINSNQFNAYMNNPQTRQTLAQYGIHNWDDMNNPQKNSYFAALLQQQRGFEPWFASPLNLRQQGPPQQQNLGGGVR